MPVAYWPCEDGSGASNFASGIAGQPPMTFGGVTPPSLAADSASFVGSAALPTVGSSVWAGAVPRYSGGTANVLRMVVNYPGGGPIATLAQVATTGDAKVLELQLQAITGNLQATAINASGLATSVTGPVLPGAGPMMVSAELYQSGGNIDLDLWWMSPGQTSATDAGAALVTWASVLGSSTSVVVNPNGANLGATTIGHVSVFSSLNAPLSKTAGPLAAWAGERAANRFARLCRENGVQPRIYGFPGFDKWNPGPNGQTS